MILARTTLAREANEKAAEVRDELGIAYNAPLCVFDACARLDPPVRVQFVDISMEGLYVRSKRPLIQVSALRPLPRRVTNCAHELGHHVFGHGSTIDELQEESAANSALNPNEFLANAFAGFFLMPLLAVRRAFTLRGWRPETATAEQCFVVACSLGVGQETLIQHMAFGLRIISATQAQALLRTRLPAIRRGLLGEHAAERLLVIDRHHAMPTADTEVGTHVLLPAGTEAEFDGLAPVAELPAGRLFLARRPGPVRVYDPSGAWAVVIRVARYQYVGWSQNRHLELEEGDDE
jgi:Zn-dependent peptidase ImmA (M78 family)